VTVRAMQAQVAAPLRATQTPLDIRKVRQSIESWLLDNAQLAGGTNAGGVAGAIDADGGVVYVYPEIAGYFLQWLAWLRAQGKPSPGLVRRAASCQRWLASWIERTDSPQTRVHLQVHMQDWRNGGLFFFDLAMVLRGLAAAAELELIRADERLIGSLVRHLSALIAPDGMFVACRATSPTPALPARWSTRRGGFLAKAAAGILSAARVLPQVSHDLQRAAELTLDGSIRLAVEHPHEEVHPRIYAIEGALAPVARQQAAASWPLLRRQVDGVLAAALPHGLPSESPSSAGVRRLDAAAQCVRAAYLLGAQNGPWSVDRDAVGTMLLAIVDCTSPEGTLPFAATGATRSVWAAMFAEQALSLATLDPGDPFFDAAPRWIV